VLASYVVNDRILGRVEFSDSGPGVHTASVQWAERGLCSLVAHSDGRWSVFGPDGLLMAEGDPPMMIAPDSDLWLSARRMACCALYMDITPWIFPQPD